MWTANEDISYLDQVHVVGEAAPVARLNEQHISLQVEESYMDFSPKLVMHIHIHIATQNTCSKQTPLGLRVTCYV